MQHERLPIVQQMILRRHAATRAARRSAKLLPFQRDDFAGILRAMAGLPVTIRLLDPPLHEFLPSLEELLVETTELRLTKGTDDRRSIARRTRCSRRVQQLHEQNPMLGLRVCRLGIVFPEIYAMQVRAIFEAACDTQARRRRRPARRDDSRRRHARRRCRPRAMRPSASPTRSSRGAASSSTYRIGTMIELPRACVVADELAEYAEFFSFGTNDLTQTTYGYSRDDAEASFIPRLSGEAHSQRRSVPSARPARRRRADAQGGQPRARRARRPEDRHLRRARRRAEQRRVLRSLGLDYVSCSPYRVPIARLAAAQSAIGALDLSARRGHAPRRDASAHRRRASRDVDVRAANEEFAPIGFAAELGDEVGDLARVD